MIALVLVTAALGGLAILITGQTSTSRDVDVLGRVEKGIASDLGWLKSYAKIWRLTSGPYNLTATQTGASTYTISTNTLEYQPDRTDVTPTESRCSTSTTSLAQAFITDASTSTAQTALTPNRPFALSTSAATTLTGLGLPAGLSLTRTIAFTKTVSGTNVSVPNTVYITYTLNNNAGVASYRFVREVALIPEAAAWCR
ncbi:MAG: hypothetical protein ACKO0M_01600 [Cyanobium sp.]